MEHLYITASPTSPEIDFRFNQHTLSMRGESYPENAAAFYGPVIERVRAYLASCNKATITANVSLAYFNSSSTKMLFSLFESLNDAALAGNNVRLNWYHDEDGTLMFSEGDALGMTFFVAMRWTFFRDFYLTLDLERLNSGKNTQTGTNIGYDVERLIVDYANSVKARKYHFKQIHVVAKIGAQKRAQ